MEPKQHHACPECQEAFLDTGALRRHETRAHGGEPPAGQLEEGHPWEFGGDAS